MTFVTDESVLFIEVSSIQRCPDREREVPNCDFFTECYNEETDKDIVRDDANSTKYITHTHTHTPTHTHTHTQAHTHTSIYILQGRNERVYIQQRTVQENME